MSADNNLILAGVAGGGTSGTALMRVAPLGTAMPTSAAASLDNAFLDPGWITEDGLKKAVSVESTKINAFGSSGPVRILKTSVETTFEIAFLESNPVSLAIYNELALDTLTPDASGRFDFTEGSPRTQKYAAVFDLVDGANAIRAVVPNFEVTDKKEFEIKAGAAVQYGVTLTAYPGGDGVAIHWYYVLDALAESGS